jgi:hypothetical protein
VSTLGLEPELFLLTTGTFNLVVKDRRRCPPERGVFSPAKLVCTSADAHAYMESGCPRNLLKLLVLLLSCQPIAATGFPPVFHIGNSTSQSGVSRLRNRTHPSSDSLCQLQRQVRREPVSARAGSEDSWLRKELWRFCENAKPFEDRCPRIEAPWPRLISGVSTC